MVLCARVHCVAASWLPAPPPPKMTDTMVGCQRTAWPNWLALYCRCLVSGLLYWRPSPAPLPVVSPLPTVLPESVRVNPVTRPPSVRSSVPAALVNGNFFPSPPPVTPLRFRLVGRDELCLWFYFYFIFPSSSCVVFITHSPPPFFFSLFFGWLYIANINSISIFKEKNPDFYAMVQGLAKNIEIYFLINFIHIL